MDLMKALTSQYMKQELPEVQVGDTVRVHVKIKEGSRERIQIFEGTVIAKKHGGIEESITVRRISYGVGCEKVFPIHAPNVVDVECVRDVYKRQALCGARCPTSPPASSAGSQRAAHITPS